MVVQHTGVCEMHDEKCVCYKLCFIGYVKIWNLFD